MSAQIQCPLCGNGDNRRRFTSYLRCANCGLVFRSSIPSAAELDHYYQSAWASPQDAVDATGATGPELAKAYARKLAVSLGRSDFRGVRILDYGAGKGDMLVAMRDLGAEVFGVEPYGHGNLEEQGTRTFRSIQDLPKNFEFNGILSTDVIEHVECPWRTVAELRQRLEKTGWLYLATPNADSLSARVLAGRWTQAANPGHLHLFSPNSITLMLRQCGFRQVRRLRWFVRYRVGLGRRLLHLPLQLLSLDGELRFLAFG